MVVLFPVSLLVAWGISRLLLKPWMSMVVQAETISAGRLDERIGIENPSDEIGRLAATLNRTFDLYQNLLDRMQRFSYDASHQLRNPLAAIRTHSEVCLKQPRSEEEYRRVIEGILESTLRLGRIVDQLLLLARAAAGSLDEYRNPLCLQDIARAIVEEGTMIGELNDVSVALRAPDEPVMVNGVADLIREAISNLVDNALKFTPKGGRIEVAVKPPASGMVRVEVSDSGAGLTPAQKATIFRPFERGTSNDQEGTGLGLAIVADVCRAHNGAFGVEDSAGRGCCFWMEFPV
jgi:two-component system heavy metal sensor histidine kinase CusS